MQSKNKRKERKERKERKVCDSLTDPIHLLPPLLQHLVTTQLHTSTHRNHPTIWGENNAFGHSLPGGQFRIF